jgi:hypothetical protein
VRFEHGLPARKRGRGAAIAKPPGTPTGSGLPTVEFDATKHREAIDAEAGEVRTDATPILAPLCGSFDSEPLEESAPDSSCFQMITVPNPVYFGRNLMKSMWITDATYP